MNSPKAKNTLCQRVKKDGTPYKKNALVGADFCLSHNVSQKKGWVFWFTVITGLATLIGLILAVPPFISYMNPPANQEGKVNSEIVKKTPFFLTSNENTSPVFSTFEGTYLVFQDRVELHINTAGFKHNHLTAENIPVKFLTSGLAIRSNSGSWRIIYSSESKPIDVLLPPIDKSYGVKDIEFSIPYPSDLDLKKYHLVIGPMIQTESKVSGNKEQTTFVSKPEWLAHSDDDIFKDYKIVQK